MYTLPFRYVVFVFVRDRRKCERFAFRFETKKMCVFWRKPVIFCAAEGMLAVIPGGEHAETKWITHQRIIMKLNDIYSHLADFKGSK